jgi:hypothetical protein
VKRAALAASRTGRGGDTDARGEQQHLGAGLETKRVTVDFRHEPQQHVGDPARRQQARQTADEREQQALGHPLPCERPAAGAERDPDGQFARAPARAHEQKAWRCCRRR